MIEVLIGAVGGFLADLLFSVYRDFQGRHELARRVQAESALSALKETMRQSEAARQTRQNINDQNLRDVIRDL